MEIENASELKRTFDVKQKELKSRELQLTDMARELSEANEKHQVVMCVVDKIDLCGETSAE